MHVVEEFGRANLIEVIPAVADQIATICYTSVSSPSEHKENVH